MKYMYELKRSFLCWKEQLKKATPDVSHLHKFADIRSTIKLIKIYCIYTHNTIPNCYVHYEGAFGLSKFNF